jgi:hypothetical protein
MTNDKLLSQSINFLRFPLIIGILYVHFYLAKTGLSIHGVKYGADAPDWFFYLNVFCSGILSAVSVPMFFWFSGLLFFYKTEFCLEAYKKKLRRRVRTLLVPYILWNLIAILWTAKIFVPGLSSLFSNADGVKLNLTIWGFINCFYDNSRGLFLAPEVNLVNPAIPINGPLWYIRDLMVLVLISPVLYWLIKKLRVWLLLVMAVFYLFIHLPGYANQFMAPALFFSWGAYYSINKVDVIERFRKVWFAPLVFILVSIIDLATYGTSVSLLMGGLEPFIGIVSLMVIASYLLEKGKVKVNETLANSSFFIFALHTMIIFELAKVLFLVLHLPDSPYALLGLYLTVPFITAFVCIGLYLFLKRFMPTLCSWLTGGR